MEAQSTGARQPRPFALPRPPFAPTPPAKHSTFLREQMSHRQAHRQTHRHSHAPMPWETAGLHKLLSQSQSTWQRPGPDERAGGRLSEDTSRRMTRMLRDVRLIPVVLVATASLFALKVSGIVFDGGY